MGEIVRITIKTAEESTLDGIDLQETMIKNCVLISAHVRTSVVHDSTFDNCKLDRTTIHNSTFKNCRLINCVVRDSSFVDSKLHETNTANSDFLRTTNTRSRLAFRKFPPEVREMIFRRCLYFGGKTPSLLIALRGDPELYREALVLFYKLNIFRLNGSNYTAAKLMSKSAVQGIHSIDLW
jgi:uncharacterized protein YjbI with pentapeptide repeats